MFNVKLELFGDLSIDVCYLKYIFFPNCQAWARKQIVKDIRKRLDSAGARRAAHMQQIVAKANDENIKVDEVIFINK